MGRRYKCPYCDKREERGKLITHIDRVHKDMLPENYSGARIMYDTINKIIDGHGRCRVCKQPTNWNEKTSRYDTLCDNPKCKEHMREEYKKNMLRVRGTYNILNDPEQQQKMLANRSISGTYKYSDGSTFTYTGSYEKKFLEFMDTVLEVPSKDILMPGPTLEYTYKGKKHMYLTDALYLPYNLIIEIKDGGSNLNGKESPGMIASREKTIAKEKLITDKGEYNYIRLTDNNFAQLIEIFMSLKMNALNGDDSKIVRINESYEYDNLTKFSAYHLEYKRDGFNKDKPNTWDEELYSKDIDHAIRNDIMGKYDLKDKKSIEAYVYTTTKDLKPIYLGIISIRLFDDNKFDWEWSEQESLDKDTYKEIINNPIEESSKINNHNDSLDALRYAYEYLNESMKGAVNDKGQKVPEICDKCGSPVRVYIQGEPVYLCTNCKKYFGTVPFRSKNKKKKVAKESTEILGDLNFVFYVDELDDL